MFFSIVSPTALAALAVFAPIDSAARGYGSRNSQKDANDADLADEFHAVFPMGCDRNDSCRPNGYMELGNLLYRTTDAMLMIYRP